MPITEEEFKLAREDKAAFYLVKFLQLAGGLGIGLLTALLFRKVIIGG